MAPRSPLDEGADEDSLSSASVSAESGRFTLLTTALRLSRADLLMVGDSAAVEDSLLLDDNSSDSPDLSRQRATTCSRLAFPDVLGSSASTAGV